MDMFVRTYMVGNDLFAPGAKTFRGTAEELRQLTSIPPSAIPEAVKHLSLPYLSPCQELPPPDDRHYATIKEDHEYRNEVLMKAKDRYDPAWWCYLHACHYVTIFIVIPMMKILYPQQPFYLLDTRYHCLLLSSANLPSPLTIDRTRSFDGEGVMIDLLSDVMEHNLSDMSLLLGEGERIFLLPMREALDHYDKHYGEKTEAMALWWAKIMAL